MQEEMKIVLWTIYDEYKPRKQAWSFINIVGKSKQWKTDDYNYSSILNNINKVQIRFFEMTWP